MSAHHVSIRSTGLVTSVGLSSAASCAAFRAKIANPTETRFIDSGGEWIMAHQVELDQPWRGLTKLAKMAAMAIAEALDGIPKSDWADLPLLLCVAEEDRPGRTAGLDDKLFLQIQDELGSTFSADSAVIPQGRVGVAAALSQARSLMAKPGVSRVLVAATDSLLSWPTLSHYEKEGRLLTAANSNGFIPGEAAGALLVSVPASHPKAPELICVGLGFSQESAHIASDEPLRAEGLTRAVRSSLAEAGRQLHECNFRITDNSGEHYYFKESALVLPRLMRSRKPEFDLWHPAECTGESGAACGAVILAAVFAACGKGYSPGPDVLAHWSNDAGQRAAVALHFGESP